MDVVTPAPLNGPLAPRLEPGSHLVEAARDLVTRHHASVVDGQCQRCDEPYPCQMAEHAAQVCVAAGLDPDTIALDPPPPSPQDLAA